MSLQKLLRRRSIRYVLAGGFGYVVNLVVFSAVAFVAGPYVALAVAFVANTASNFVINRWWTFGGSSDLHQSVRRYTALAVGLLALNYTTFHLIYGVAGVPAVPAQALSIIIGLPIGFLLSRWWAFAPDHARA